MRVRLPPSAAERRATGASRAFFGVSQQRRRGCWARCDRCDRRRRSASPARGGRAALAGYLSLGSKSQACGDKPRAPIAAAGCCACVTRKPVPFSIRRRRVAHFESWLYAHQGWILIFFLPARDAAQPSPSLAGLPGHNGGFQGGHQKQARDARGPPHPWPGAPPTGPSTVTDKTRKRAQQQWAQQRSKNDRQCMPRDSYVWCRQNYSHKRRGRRPRRDLAAVPQNRGQQSRG